MQVVAIAVRSDYEIALNGIADDQRTQRAVQAVEPEIAIAAAIIKAVATVCVFATQGRKEQVVVCQQLDGRCALVVCVAHFISQ